MNITGAMIEAAARALYYDENHPGSVPGWTMADAKQYQPQGGVAVVSGVHKKAYLRMAKAALHAAAEA